jgi:hypothetical protein
MRLSIQIGVCLLVLVCCFFTLLSKQNELTNLRISIPKKEKSLRLLKEAIAKIQYDIDQFEDPQNLLHIAAKDEFHHLKHPYFSNVVTVSEGLAVQETKEPKSGFSVMVPFGMK